MKKSLTIIGALMFILGLSQYVSAILGGNDLAIGSFNPCDVSVGWEYLYVQLF